MHPVKQRLVRAGVVLSLSLRLAGGAVPAELSGNWKLNVEKSKFGALPAPVSRAIEIVHQEPELKLTIRDESGAEKRSQSLAYNTDGKESVNVVRGREFRSVARWEGAVLIVETKGVHEGEQFMSKDRWSMSEDRNTITMERHAANPYGETHQTHILEKQLSAAASPA